MWPMYESRKGKLQKVLAFSGIERPRTVLYCLYANCFEKEISQIIHQSGFNSFRYLDSVTVRKADVKMI